MKKLKCNRRSGKLNSRSVNGSSRQHSVNGQHLRFDLRPWSGSGERSYYVSLTYEYVRQSISGKKL